MAIEITTLIFDPVTGRATGTGFYTHVPRLDNNELECSSDQYEDWSNYTLEDGVIVFSPPEEVAPTIDDIRSSHIETLRAACETAIISGFKSNALGNTHTYPSDIKAQINLMGSVTDSIMPNLPANWTTPFWVCNSMGVWNWEMHDAAQIQQAGRDGKAHVVSCQVLLAELTATVLTTATAEAVASIIWPEGAGA